MYALIHKNQLILGPIQFNTRMINSVLEDELEINFTIQPRDFQLVPIHIDEDTHLVEAIQEVPPYDPSTHFVGNFTWEINHNEESLPESVTFTFPIIEKTLEQVKAEILPQVSQIRREKEETSTIEIEVDEVTVKVSTSREQRLSFVSKLISSPGPHKFKFDNNIWLEIDNNTLEQIIHQIDVKVQEAFDWEFDKIAEINSCSTVQEVFDVTLREDTPLMPLI